MAPNALSTGLGVLAPEDRKSTHLNSSHGYISYAVFCLKKKKKIFKFTNSNNILIYILFLTYADCYLLLLNFDGTLSEYNAYLFAYHAFVSYDTVSVFM